ncbi:MAG: Ig-like domain-containing protein [Patescibacteria group bacterium]
MAGDRYRSKKNRSGFAYFILTVLFVFFMVKWGVPLFVDLVAGPTGTKGGLLNNSEDNVPPQTPVLSALPEVTNSAEVTVEGYTEPKAEISVWRNEEMVASDKSDAGGAFKVNLRLTEGENRIQVKAKDEKENESESLIKTIVYDKSEITITVEAPTDGAEIFGKSNQNLTVSGKASQPEATVTVNGSFARVDSGGKFSVVIRLNEGDNDILVKAVGRAGNTAEKAIKVKLTL